MSTDLDLLAALRRYGFDAATTSPDGRTWQLGPEEFRSAEVAALFDALPRWVAWASEPFEPSRWQRLRTRLGLPSE